MDRLERLVNLVAALIDTPRPLTRADIAERIEGYSSDPEAFRRNFERDKELLRQSGFPLVTETLPDAIAGEDVGYRIPRELYELPDPGLDEEELGALRLAASAVQLAGGDGGWTDAVVAALRKLGGAADLASGAGGAPKDLAITGLAALPADETAATIFAAVGERRRLRFSYKDEERLVDPWRLSFHRGHWYLAGLDHGRGEERLYRLDRFDTGITEEGDPGSFERPDVTRTAPPPAWRIGEGKEIVAYLRVDAERADLARRELGEATPAEPGPDGSVTFEVAVTNTRAFRSFVLGYLDHAQILGPEELVEDMIAWLESVAGTGASARRATS